MQPSKSANLACLNPATSRCCLAFCIQRKKASGRFRRSWPNGAVGEEQRSTTAAPQRVGVSRLEAVVALHRNFHETSAYQRSQSTAPLSGEWRASVRSRPGICPRRGGSSQQPCPTISSMIQPPLRPVTSCCLPSGESTQHPPELLQWMPLQRQSPLLTHQTCEASTLGPCTETSGSPHLPLKLLSPNKCFSAFSRRTRSLKCL